MNTLGEKYDTRAVKVKRCNAYDCSDTIYCLAYWFMNNIAHALEFYRIPFVTFNRTNSNYYFLGFLFSTSQ